MIPITGYTPEDLLDTAQALLSRTDANAKGLWPRAAAHLCRQALEASLAQWWAKRLPGMENATMRAQLACLPTYLTDDGLAGRVAYTWSGLSEACHHHVYELAPTATELSAWLDTATELVEAVAISERG
jgi:hypothetical protein